MLICRSGTGQFREVSIVIQRGSIQMGHYASEMSTSHTPPTEEELKFFRLSIRERAERQWLFCKERRREDLYTREEVVTCPVCFSLVSAEFIFDHEEVCNG